MAKVVEAQDYIYGWGNTVDGLKVENTLGEGSWVPVLNQFVKKLGPFSLDPFRMLVIDLMHECELGTWKALFTHLLRLLYALPRGSEIIAALDGRFRQVPTFGNGIIRKFSNNTSEMKRLAARDFEDILQCAIPVFEGLFPTNHDEVVQTLLYHFAQWHALAKLRVHSDSTIDLLNETFKKLSQKLCKFLNYTCTAYTTVELPREKSARQRRDNQRSETNGTLPTPGSNSAKAKRFNLSTYKFHAMGDYVRTIKFFGTTDSFTTQIGELAHRALKAFYPLTKVESFSGPGQPEANAPPPVSSDHHHSIATSQNNLVNLFAFLREHDGDPAIKNFIPRLRDHILYRMRGLDVSHCDHSFTDKECNSVIIPNNTVYSVQTMQIHYTTYDFRREYDTINPRSHGDVMVLSGETAPSHPYWYACVLGIYHVEVWLNHGGQPVKRYIEFLWVRWLAVLQGHKSGMKHARLPKIAFVEESDPDAFGFLDPGQDASQRSSTTGNNTMLGFDRDMFMCYTHLSIGHSAMLRRITRDCLGSGLVTHTNASNEEDSEDHKEAGDGEGYECDKDDEDDEDDDEEGHEESDDELGDGELDGDLDDGFEDISF
ncbi:hypothetical protein CY34DRAFT_16002 [Suillus luteus UH-Slu-Lm8-n1]|uniref:Unplaced genomic scaffold CY34scaffold_351, whole genome shotgun sequence n=1 Tax=Suillus luteus UH-Slu-Lm8-n1 TaxID=930992 RepID=A0A0D0AYV3_9AGAM|nr:hypothetical protein CY34DRAFT_16002 [Suillus luteus UH-Slu-Lm8-n1]